jgi:hypothetical protein
MPRTASTHALAAALASAALFCAPPLLRAQDAEGLHVGLAGGTSTPTGALGDRARTGYNLLGNVAWQPHNRSPFELRAEVGYSHFGLTDGYLSRFRRAIICFRLRKSRAWQPLARNWACRRFA